ncbi:unnamed protein product [Diamesa serratosioi]
MANVEYRLENSIEELEIIKSLKLLSDEEIQKIKKQRSAFEHQISANKTEIKTFVNYVKFEVALMCSLKEKGFLKEVSGRQLGTRICNRVRYIYRDGLKRFPNSKPLWAQYIIFAKKKYRESVSEIYQQMLNYHKDKEVYLEAAEFEMEQKNFTSASRILIEAIGKHPTCRELSQRQIYNNLKQGQDNEDARPNALKSALSVYQATSSNFKTVNFFIDALNMVQEFDYAKPLQDLILLDVMRKHADEELTWNMLAVRHINGLFYNAPETVDISVESASTEPMEPISVDENVSEEADMIKSNDELQKEPERTLEERLKMGITIYEKAISTIKTQKMFTFYIDKLLELDNEYNDQVHRVLIRRGLGGVFKKGLEADCLSEKHFLIYLRLLSQNFDKNVEQLEDMFETGARLYPHCTEIYELWMKYYLEKENYEKYTEIFKLAIKKNPDNELKYWNFYLMLLMTNPNEHQKVYDGIIEAIKTGSPAVANYYKPFLIEYITMTRSIQEARNEYVKLSEKATPCLELHTTMAEMESRQIKSDMKNWRGTHENSVMHFGEKNPDVWMSFVKFELKFEPKKVGDIYNRAKGKLIAEHWQKFQTDFALLQTQNGCIEVTKIKEEPTLFNDKDLISAPKL